MSSRWEVDSQNCNINSDLPYIFAYSFSIHDSYGEQKLVLRFSGLFLKFSLFCESDSEFRILFSDIRIIIFINEYFPSNQTTQLQNDGAFDSKTIIWQSKYIPRLDLSIVGKNMLHFKFAAMMKINE